MAEFAGNWLTTEGGALLLRQADRKLGLLRRVARCFTDYRQPECVEHRLEEMLAQRIYGLALGYEDWNDHELLRQDPLLGCWPESAISESARREKYSEPAGIAARRFPRSRALQHKIAHSPAAIIDELLVTLFLESHRKARDPSLWIWMPRTRPAWEAGSAFLPWLLQPLLLSAAVHFLWPPTVVCSVAAFEPRYQCREPRGGATDGRQWPPTQIILRAEFGFCREERMAWCEKHAVDYVFGFARNQRLRRKIAKEMRHAKKEQQRTGDPHACSASSSTRRTRPGAGAGGSSPKRNSSPARRIRATW